MCSTVPVNLKHRNNYTKVAKMRQPQVKEEKIVEDQTKQEFIGQQRGLDWREK